MKFENFKKMWIEVAEKFKAEHPDWDPSKGAITDTCSPEVLAFLDEIAACPKEELGKLLGIPVTGTEGILAEARAKLKADAETEGAPKDVRLDGILGAPVPEPDPTKVVRVPGIATSKQDYPPDVRKILNELLTYYGYGLHGGNGGVAFVKNFGDTPLEACENYVKAMRRGAPLGDWIRNLSTISKQVSHGKKVLFVHGGIPHSLQDPARLEDYAEAVRIHMDTSTATFHKHKDYGKKYGIENPLVGKKSVFWDRGIPQRPEAEAKALADALKTDYIVIGHTPQRNGQIANYANRIFNIDIGMSPVYGENTPCAILFDEEGPKLFNSKTGISPLIKNKEPEIG